MYICRQKRKNQVAVHYLKDGPKIDKAPSTDPTYDVIGKIKCVYAVYKSQTCTTTI